MRNKKIPMIMGCFLASLFFACSGNEEVKVSEEPKENCSTQVSNINPNGDSELALLMRKTFVDADSIKQLIINNKGTISDEFIAELERAHKAQPTDPKVKTAEFSAYNTLLVNQAKALQAVTENKTEVFNQLVNRCLDCHKSFCPGPMVKIEKLKIINPNH